MQSLAKTHNKFVKHRSTPTALRWTHHCVLRRLQKRYVTKEMVQRYILTVIIFLISGCSVVGVSDLPCNDGWSSKRDAKGDIERTQIWEATYEFEQEALASLPANEKIGCYHIYPSRDIIIVSYEKRGEVFATDYSFTASGYIQEERSVVIHLEH